MTIIQVDIIVLHFGYDLFKLIITRGFPHLQVLIVLAFSIEVVYLDAFRERKMILMEVAG